MLLQHHEGGSLTAGQYSAGIVTYTATDTSILEVAPLPKGDVVGSPAGDAVCPRTLSDNARCDAPATHQNNIHGHHLCWSSPIKSTNTKFSDDGDEMDGLMMHYQRYWQLLSRGEQLAPSSLLFSSKSSSACGTVLFPIPPGWNVSIPPGMDPIPPGIEARRRGSDHLWQNARPQLIVRSLLGETSNTLSG